MCVCVCGEEAHARYTGTAGTGSKKLKYLHQCGIVCVPGCGPSSLQQALVLRRSRGEIVNLRPATENVFCILTNLLTVIKSRVAIFSDKQKLSALSIKERILS